MALLTLAQTMKLHILAEGIGITQAARGRLTDALGSQKLSSFDYASTSGIILELEPDVWVNAPVTDHNANFVVAPSCVLDVDAQGLLVRCGEGEVRASYCRQPRFHHDPGEWGGRPGRDSLMDYVVSHADRARLSPLHGCSMVCDFCNIPFDVPMRDYTLFPIERCVQALRIAVDDPEQPARHIMVSGGTPKPKDVANHRELYACLLRTFPDVPIDIMMVPVQGIFDLDGLASLGVGELSINLEVFDPECEQKVARGKFHVGRQHYLDFIEEATNALGPCRVRSMLMVGLEPMESTMAGVRAIAERGGVPVLSPFRPDPATPLKDMRSSTFIELRETYLRAREAAELLGASLGPSCPPCTHNTVSFADDAAGNIIYRWDKPVMMEV